MVKTKIDLFFYIVISSFSVFVTFFIGRMYDTQPMLSTILIIILWLIVLMSIYLHYIWRRRLFQTVQEQVKAVADHPNTLQIDSIEGYEEIVQSVKKLQTDLTKGEQLRTQMVADVAHELRTPISIFKGQLESIIEGAVPLTSESLLPLLDETSRMSKLILDLRQLSLAESGHLKLDRSWVKFDELVQEVSTILQVEAEEKKISLKLVGATNTEIYCDLSRLKQVFINLVGNAIRYTGANGHVEICLDKVDDRVHIAIKDTGQGIPIEYLPYVFQRFYRIEASRSRDFGGMGLGLAIAKEFVVAHGGEINVDSELGKGTVFKINLPIFPIS